jgi:hypothetical protein
VSKEADRYGLSQLTIFLGSANIFLGSMSSKSSLLCVIAIVANLIILLGFHVYARRSVKIAALFGLLAGILFWSAILLRNLEAPEFIVYAILIPGTLCPLVGLLFIRPD